MALASAMPDWRSLVTTPGDTLKPARLRPLHLPISHPRPRQHSPVPHLNPPPRPRRRGRCASPLGKDTTTGHWGCGILLPKPLPTYPNGFPAGLMAEYERRIGRGTLGNYTASGTDIIRDLGPEHMATGKPIVYTSADSVFQIAAHEEVIPIPELYRMCEIARELLTGPHEVGRVIARPFVGQPGAFTRTSNRHDYAVAPPPGMLIDQLAANNVPVVALARCDIFLGRGHPPGRTNADGMANLAALASWTRSALRQPWISTCSTATGDPKATPGLEAADAWLPIMRAPEEASHLTADRCDPTPSTDTAAIRPILAWASASRRRPRRRLAGRHRPDVAANYLSPPDSFLNRSELA